LGRVRNAPAYDPAFMIYDIEHSTEYRFHHPVQLGLHRLTFRPRDGHDMRVLATQLDVTPQPQRIDLVHDVYGNSVAFILPASPADVLRIVSRFAVDHLGSNSFGVPTASESLWMPPAYSAAERLALTPFLIPSFDDPGHVLRSWAQPFADQGAAGGGPRQAIASMSEALRHSLAYTRRETEGVQTPQETLSLRAGACRDYATLMIDALRHIGIAARVVSGYLYSPGGSSLDGGGATHAWVQVYLPDCGWFPVDPTNNLIGGNELIRIAFGREASEVAPLSGEWFGAPGDYTGMTVDVSVIARV
jgi:transglutaminase-like putative cysteine protease